MPVPSIPSVLLPNWQRVVPTHYLGSAECPGIGNYESPRISRGISHTSNILTLQTLELLEGWRSWKWENIESSTLLIISEPLSTQLLL